MARAWRRTALIVEDDPVVRELGAEMLREFDLDVDQAVSAEAAIDHLCARAGQVELVIADIHLSGAMTGIDLAHRIAVLWPAVSVIVTSGDSRAPVVCLPRQATYVPKPWRPLDIVAAAERASRADHSVHAVQL